MTALSKAQTKAFNAALADKLRAYGFNASGDAWAWCKTAQAEFPLVGVITLVLAYHDYLRDGERAALTTLTRNTVRRQMRGLTQPGAYYEHLAAQLRERRRQERVAA